MKMKFLIPFIVFVGLVGFLAVGLNRDPRHIPSPLVGKPAPMFNIAQLTEQDKNFSPESMKGQVWVMNVWASWCVACREEHPALVEFHASKAAPLIGLDYKDVRTDALMMLAREGNPYELSVFDISGRVGIDYGVYGVPETFVIDKKGVIRYKHIGPLSREALVKKIYPLIEELNKS